MGLHRTRGEHQFLGLRQSHRLREEIIAAAVGRETNAGKALDEFHAFGGVAKIAGDGDIEARARRDAVHHRDDRLRHHVDQPHDHSGLRNETATLLRRLQVVERAEVAARAERAPFPGQDDNTHFRVVLGLMELCDPGVDQIKTHGVQALRAVQRQNGDAALLFVLDDFLRHEISLLLKSLKILH